MNIQWYVLNCRIALSKTYIVSSKKDTFFDHVSSEK